MRKRDIRRREMLERVGEFGAAHRDIFPPSSFAGRMFAVAAEASASLQRHEVAELDSQTVGRHDAKAKAAARLALRRRLSLVSRMARVAAVDRPGFDKKFRVRFDCSDERLLARARSFVKAAGPLARTFMAHDMPPTFLAKLQADIDAFVHAIASHQDGRERRAGTRENIDAEMRSGLQATRRLAVVVPHTLEDPALLAAWNAVLRLGSSPRSRKPAAA